MSFCVSGIFFQLLLSVFSLTSLAYSSSPPDLAGCKKAVCFSGPLPYFKLTSSKKCSSATLLQLTVVPAADRYWAKQVSETVPACYVRPQSASQVARILRTARKHACPFAISGGGHSDNPGASNLQGGITIDLSSFKNITVSRDHTVTSVGPGLNWGEVYERLEKSDLIVMGGRESSVGVSGLTLGGGISYLSGIHGWACDNVKNYEVVLADGRVVNANANGKHADLYKALRGGGNNFGIVTRFDLDTYPQGLMNGGLTLWSDSAAIQKALVTAFVKFTKNSHTDPKGHTILSITNIAGNYLWAASLIYSQPASNPQVLHPFRTSLLNSAKVSDTTRNTSYAELAAELGNTQPSGRRQQFHTATFRLNSEFIIGILQIYRDEVKRIRAAYNGTAPLLAPFALQPMTSDYFKFMCRRGGNVLGLEGERENLFILSMAWPWDNAEDDDLFEGAMQTIISKSVALAKKMGTFYGYIYMNYAVPSDPVIQSYGLSNVRFLKSVSKRYDPQGVFQTLVPGGFKL